MAEKTNESCELNTKNNENLNKKANIVQIILQYEVIYLIKIGVFIFILLTIILNLATIEDWKSSDLVSSLTFVLSACVDSAVLAKNLKMKGVIANLLFVDFIFLISSAVFVCTAFIGYISFEQQIYKYILYIVNIICCLSPFLEIIFDIAIRLQNEKNSNF